MIKELRFADDTTLLETIEEEIQLILDNVKQESEQVGLYLNVSKTKMMVVGGSNDSNLRVDGQTVEDVSDQDPSLPMKVTRGRRLIVKLAWESPLSRVSERSGATVALRKARNVY